MSDKIKSHHLTRAAYVYVRQSTSGQVMNNVESQNVQYNLCQRAEQLGWPSSQIIIIDQDLGCSASGTAKRSGFESLLTNVCASNVGAIFSVDASRLARNGREWHTLLELCATVETLLIDRDAIYDPATSNDRLLLGFKGEFSEMELRVLRERSQAAIQEKARRGELYFMISAGYVKGTNGILNVDPDQRVKQAIELVFCKFRELGSIRQVYNWFVNHKIELPIATYKNGIRLQWKLPNVKALGSVLKNPIYAGVYAYGKTKREVEIRNGKRYVKKGIVLPQNEWMVLIQNHHIGYISWDEYQKNQTVITNNTNSKRPIVTGSTGCGEALMSGILRCGHCGSKLMTRYQGANNKSRVYLCRGKGGRSSKACISFGGKRVDEALSNTILDILSPLGLEAALKATEMSSATQSQVRQQRLLSLDQAQYQASLAKRQYAAIDPENRLVAAALESDWNDALKKVSLLKNEIAELEQQCVLVSDQDRQAILSLSDALPYVWNHRDSDNDVKKKIIRIVIREIIAYVESTSTDKKIIKLKIHWQGGDHTELEVDKNRYGETNQITSAETKTIIASLARMMSDNAMTGVLNRLGKRTATGLTWTPARICAFRNSQHISAYKEGEREARGEMTPEEVSYALGVSVSKVRKMIKRGILPAKQACTGAPWLIEKNDLTLEQVQHAIKSTISRIPLTPDSKQQSLKLQ